eukprot:TRINITY_DN3561_c0_g1_i2.p1 TRINITY_DN3561_c0_g1~~TRINITY_DN3561_c0_g1_i2.p1  ORF type:complete len:204 (+),score=34.35 TRINITY_DN3561_c0_g1_i2:53-664(+)
MTHVGLIIALIFLTVFFLLLIGFIGYYLYFHRGLRQKLYPPLLPPFSSSHKSFRKDRIVLGGVQVHLSEKVGAGSHGSVYKGEWKGLHVAVKKIPDIPNSEQVKAYEKEVILLSRLAHPNIIKFLGAVSTPNELVLVMEYMNLGSLYSILHDTSRPEVSWKKKKKLALDAAQGLHFLHSSEPPIIHRDFKSHNILVNTDWNAK